MILDLETPNASFKNSIYHELKMSQSRQRYDSCVPQLPQCDEISYSEGRSRQVNLDLFAEDHKLFHKRDTIETDYGCSSYTSKEVESGKMDPWRITLLPPKKIVGISHSLDANNLTEDFMIERCFRFYNGTLMLDLSGKAVQSFIKRRLDEQDMDVVTGFISGNSKISGVNLGYNSISNDGFEILSQYLTKNLAVINVNVMYNDITNINMRKFKEIVSKWNVSCLRLTGNKLGTEGGRTIARLLKSNQSLRHLDLAETDQAIGAIFDLVDVMIIGEGIRTLTKLNLSRTVIKNGIGYFCRLLACLLQVNHSIAELVLTKNEICDDDFEIFLEGLKKNTVLTRLNMSCNRISSHGVEKLADILPLTKIKLLELRRNMIGDNGCTALGRIFHLTDLSYLDLAWNSIGDLGVTNLIWGINRPMDGLFIYGNKFTSHSVKVIYSQIMNSLLTANCIDITFWWDDTGSIQYAPKDSSAYNGWYYCVGRLNRRKDTIYHCCCPIRGYVLQELYNMN